MGEYLVLLRILGAVFGLLLILWAFGRFRIHIIRRREFLLLLLFGSGVVVVSLVPDSINIIAGMLAMENKQFGRLITLLILSNMLLWILVLGLRNSERIRSIQFDLLVRNLTRMKFFAEFGTDSIQGITVIIPVLDEAENLNHILPRMPKTIKGLPVGVLVIDDGSSDDSDAVVKKHGFPVVSSPLNRGGGAALRLGYDIAMMGGAEIAVTMDGDGQHLPEEIERLIEPIMKDEFDFVIASRVLGKREKDSRLRWIGIHIFNFIINALADTKITDCSNGFRAFRVDSLKQVLLLQDQFHTAELIIDAARKGIRIGEAPVTVCRRYSGESKKGRNLNYGFNFAKTILKTWFRE